MLGEARCQMRVCLFDAFDATITIERVYLAITIQWMDGIWEWKNLS